MWVLVEWSGPFQTDECSSDVHGTHESSFSSLPRSVCDRPFKRYHGILKECSRACLSSQNCSPNFKGKVVYMLNFLNVSSG